MKNFFKKLFIRVLKILIGLFVFSILWVVIYRFVDPPISGMMFYKWLTTENYTINKEWKPLEEIDSSFPLAFIAAEDQKFLNHNGFDVEAIQDAIERNKEGKNRRGASTISQQVAKNVFLFPSKNYFRKGLEVYFTGLIELIWGKRRIMEVYLNVVELGEETYGIEAATTKYFDKEAHATNRSQAALVATVLPNPIKFSLSEPSDYMYSRQAWVLKQMSNLGGEQILMEWYD